MPDFPELLAKIQDAKKKLFYLWEIKGITDSEVLKAAEEVDVLINEYERQRAHFLRGTNKIA